jgi:hypothetical protein
MSSRVKSDLEVAGASYIFTALESFAFQEENDHTTMGLGRFVIQEEGLAYHL